jgi:hypothetical protein
LLLLTAQLGLDQLRPSVLNAAFTRLADSPKGDVPLRHYLASLYRSSCPTCGAPGVAEWFAWDRDADRPFRKAVRCPKCVELQEGPVDGRDLDTAHRIQPRGLAYYYALDRVAPPDHPARQRAAELVELYTPRNLAALMDLSLRLERLEVDGEARTPLTGVLLDCFDICSSLDPYGEERPRPRTLRVPSRFLERNVWSVLENCFAHLLSEETASAPPDPEEDHPAIPRAADAAALTEGAAEGYALVTRAARDAGENIPAASAALIFADPPRPDGVFWALSALWAGWLEQSPAARALRPFLRRRRFDWDWHWHVLQVALGAAGTLLAPRGFLVTLFTDPEDTLMESVCLAASRAGYVLEGWGYSPEVGHRLVWRWSSKRAHPDGQAATGNTETLKREVTASVEATVRATLQQRGEPTGRALLHAAVYAHLSEKGLLSRTSTIPETADAPPALPFIAHAVDQAIDAFPTVGRTQGEGFADELRWLMESDQPAGLDVSATEAPLADRVESAVWALLARRPTWKYEELVVAIYADFPGRLTPDLRLVHVCIESYSELEDDTLRLRPEDEPQRRAAETEEMHSDVAELGQRLGFRVEQREDGWDLRWLEEGRSVYVFAISATAALGVHLLSGRLAAEGAQRCLIVPGGRAGLIGLKLQRDLRLARAVGSDGWQFIKFRHLRRLIAEEGLDRHALKTVLGLDPIAEQEAVQIPLF